ncbi:hypothetical protein ACFTXJ_14180 [Streptomyces zhihengii]|uniref:hypothetical protein n=1 Tax=Streptomyces zhihengii TaxID=1818004 RepID=UPI0036370EC2
MAIPGNFLSETTSSVDPNTSGWVSMLNATISLGTGGRVGDGCLAVRSVAAGEMRARTVASYPVTPFTEYLAFADASGATVPERIGIRWLTAAAVELSISWSLTTTAASASWHRIAVADYAPDGAAYAQVVVSSTPAAGAVFSYYENVYLGLPQRTTGNLLSANAETSERAAGWEYGAATNCSLSRTSPPVSWSATNYVAGGAVATATVTANGDAEYRLTEQPAVTPGQEYLGLAYLNPPSTSSTAWVELRFYDAALSQIQATRSILDEPGTGWYMQRVADVAPAGAAYATLAFGLVGATAGQLLRTDRAVITVAPKWREGSIVPYKDASFEQGVGGWTVTSGVATISRLGPWGTDSVDAFYCLSVSSASATTSVIRSPRYSLAGALPGLDWTFELSMKVQAGSWTVTRTIRWYDAANFEVGSGSTTPVAAPTPNWWRLQAADDAPVAATQAAVELTLTAGAPSSLVRVDKVSLWQTLPLDEVIPDDASASVTVKVRDLPEADAFSLWRVTADGTRTLVRGPNGLLDRVVLGTDVLVVEDYEAPLRVPFYYYGLSINSLGVPSAERTTDTVTLTHEDANVAWLKDPGNPQRNLMVVVKTPPDWQRQIAQSEYRVRGRTNPVVLSDVRAGLEGDLVIWTRSDEERRALHWLLDPGSVLLWQAVPGMGVDDMYVAVGQIVEARVSAYAPELWREWTLPLRAVDMPVTVGVAGSAGRTWQDILAEHDTWQQVMDRYATWEDVLLNRPIGG